MKSQLVSDTVMPYFGIRRKTEIIVDASPAGISAILVQKDAVNREYVVAYASLVLNETEQRYSQTEREALGVVFGRKKFHLYVYGSNLPTTSHYSQSSTTRHIMHPRGFSD